MNSTWVITRLTLREAVRRKITIAAGIIGILFLALYAFGFNFIRAQSNNGHAPATVYIEMANFILMAGLYGVAFMGLALGALLSSDTLSGEINTGTIQTLASKPMHRFQIVLGKWLGFAIILVIYVTIMAGGVITIIYFSSGYAPLNIAKAIALMVFEALVAMSTTLALSSRLSTLATGGTIFGLYGISLVGGWVEQFGSILHNQAAMNVGLITSFFFPCEALWRRAAYLMTTPLLRSFGASLFVVGVAPSAAMVVYGAVFLLVAVFIAARVFSRRDL